MSNINDICCNPRLHDLVLAGWPPCCAMPFVVVIIHRHRWAHTPVIHAASHILTIRKELHGFLFLCIRVVPFSIIMGLRLAALWAAGAPLKISLCVQIPGHEGRPLICDRSHFCIACNFLRTSAGSSAQTGCRCGVSECTCDLLVAWRPFQ